MRQNRGRNAEPGFLPQPHAEDDLHELELNFRELRRGRPFIMSGKETLRNSLITDTGSPLSFSRMERNTVGGSAGAPSSLGTVEKNVGYAEGQLA